MSSVVVRKEHLMAMVNEARMHGLTRFRVRSILLDLDLFTVYLEENTIRLLADRKGFEDALAAVMKGHDDPVLHDLPAYDDLKIAVWNSVLLPDEATGPILKELEALAADRQDPYRHPKEVCFAIDTNIAYYRLLSRLFLKGDLLAKMGCRPMDVQIIVSNIVEEEISHAVSRKYSRDDIDALQAAVRDQVLTGTMLNCCYRKGRKALNAQSEIMALDKGYNLWRIGGIEVQSDNKEEIDDEIVKSLALHAANQSLDLIFITADDKCRAHAYSHKLPSILVRYPKILPEEVGFDSWLLIELLYDLSISFIGLSFPELDLKVTGDWSGKSAEDYHEEKVKLIFGRESPIEKELWRDIEIVRGLESLVNNLPIKIIP